MDAFAQPHLHIVVVSAGWQAPLHTVVNGCASGAPRSLVGLSRRLRRARPDRRGHDPAGALPPQRQAGDGALSLISHSGFASDRDPGILQFSRRKAQRGARRP
uniref:Uncharacterized protein n=1 Tax=Rhodopseudomonas palustris (strain ATCC BAA-98 / CGA009) TaxID=258594 RepID=Q6NAA6_RHOPA|nr:hypothetical protein RPA1279 [Rhodopseudomonas palustris CGA009]